MSAGTRTKTSNKNSNYVLNDLPMLTAASEQQLPEKNQFSQGRTCDHNPPSCKPVGKLKHN
jgi:hypothetical protein